MSSFPLKTLLVAAGVALCNTLAAQNVGVGIATPAAKLEVDGGFAVTPVAVPAGAAITVPVNETVIRITNDGANVAIGVAAPASATEGQFLSIRNEDATNIATFAGTAIPAGQMAEFIFLNGGWRFRTGTAGTDWTLAGNAGTGAEVLGTTNGQPLRLITNNLERARIDANGNVGIGTTTPNAAVQLANVTTNRRIVMWEDFNNDHQFYGFGVNPFVTRYQISNTGASHVFYAGTGAATSNELMRINGFGNVGIGVTAPTTRLHINGAYANTHTAVAAAAAPVIPTNVSHVRLTAVAGAQANAIPAPAGPVEGQKLTIVNEDGDNATFAGATIAANGGVGSFIYANGVWRLESNNTTFAWGLTGNGGTVAGTNYIGTTDNQAFDIRTNGLLRARFNTGGGIYLQNPTGAGNTIIGNTNSAVTPPTGTENTALGAFAGNVLTTGINNTAIGNQAMATNSVGNFNTVVGRAALFSATGSDNTAMGHLALLFTTSGSANTAVGAGIMQVNTTGGGNTALGFFALSGNSTGNNNVAIGNGAGSANTTGSNNTLLGPGANVSANNFTNATAVGSAAVVGSSNSLVLGDNSVNVGIGSVTAPTARLHFNGAYANTFTALAAGAAPAVANNVTHVRLTDDGAAAANAIAGPGAPVDGQVLTIVNNDAQAATFAGTTIAATTGAASFVYANGAWRVYGNSLGDNLGNHIATTQIQSTLGSAAAPGYSFIGDLNTGVYSPGADQLSVSTAGAERMRVDAAGNLGLGFAAPAYRIDIANAATGGIRIQDNGFAGFPNGYQYLTIGDDAYFSDVDVANTTALYGLANPDRAGLYFGSSGALIFGIAGNFGIGNNTPSARLDVTGEIQIASTGATAAVVGAGGLRWDGTNIQYSNGAAWVNMLNGNTGWQLAGNAGTGAELLGTTNAQPLRVITNNAERMRVDANGLVGIGLINPGARLTIRNNGTDPGAFDDGKALFVSGAYNSGQAYDGGVEFRHDNLTQGIGFGFNTIYASGSNANQELNIISRGTSHITMQAYGGVTGNVGIGVVAPTAKLEVNGGGFNARLGIGTGWNGALYPTLSGTSNEQWIMIHNPHIPYLQNGVNGYIGATTGAQVRMAANTAAGTYWDAGILATLGSDAYGISRAGGGAMLSVFNNGNVGIGTTTLANTPSRLYIASGNAPAIGLDNASQLWARNNATVLEPFMWPRWVDNVMYMNFGAGGFRLRNNGSADAISIDANNRIGMNTAMAQQYRLNVFDVQLTGNGDGQATVYGYRTRDSQNDGFGYYIGQTNAGITAYNFWGDVYTFGVHGHTWGDYTRTGGVLGSTNSGTAWGSIGYKASNAVGYGVYGSTGYAAGGGYSPDGAQQNAGIGIGSYGGVMGGWVRGDVMGFATAGEVYASYNLGNEYTSGHSADIVTTADGQRHAAFANTSTSLKVYADGSSTLQAGTVYVPFDADFRALVAAGTRPTVTVTPIGECNGLHIVSIDANGFTVRENGGGSHNVEFTWIAIGKRVDAPASNALPGVVARPDFDEQMRGVMFNENNHEQSATPVWYDGQNVRFEEVPASLNPSKPEGTLSPDDLRHQESQRQQGPTAPAPQE